VDEASYIYVLFFLLLPAELRPPFFFRFYFIYERDGIELEKRIVFKRPESFYVATRGSSTLV
jgi:hypothetical protein